MSANNKSRERGLINGDRWSKTEDS
jgi:hypothetical protein